MPGDNCSVFGCGSCRRTKGIGIWKLPSARNAEYKKWREEWLSAITKTRVSSINYVLFNEQSTPVFNHASLVKARASPDDFSI